jgi:Protein of unknown function (DUF4238)
MPDLKNHHFVPRCLLRPFSYSAEGRAINLFNIRSDRSIPRAPVKGQCARNYLYGKSKKIERSLADIEGSFNSLRARVIAGSNDASDLRGLRFFSHLQLRRTEMAVKRIRESYEMMTENVLGDKNAVGIPDDHALIMESLHFCLSTQGYLDDLKIRVVENRTNIDFVISDDPAILMNRYAAQKLGGVGFGVVSSGLEQISLGSNREDSQRFINERVCRH